LGISTNYTTGPVNTSSGVTTIRAQVLNNTFNIATVTVFLYNTVPSFKVNQSQSPTVLTVLPRSSKSVTFGTGAATIPTQYEVQFRNLTTDVYGFTAGVQGILTNLDPANTFRHSELIPFDGI
jgi:hypothetical protein